MKYILAIFILTLNLSASIYYAKVEPYKKYSIKADVSGEVVFLYKKAEGRISNGGILIKLDDILNKKELKTSKAKLKSLKNTLKLTKENVANSKKIEKIRENNYERVKNLKTKSRVGKDNDFVNLINAKNQVLALSNSVENLSISISDLEYRIAVLKDAINKKSIEVAKGMLIYKTYVDKGDFVNIGMPLFDAYDISKGKLTIFLSKEDLGVARNGVLYINNKATKYKADKIWGVTDTQNISSYRTEIIIPVPKRFSELLKLEFRVK